KKGLKVVNPPFKIGKAYFICTVTLYYVGRVAEKGLGWLRMEEASWVHWTGRLSTLLKRQSFTYRDLSSRKPKVEPCGPDEDGNGSGHVGITTGSIVSWYPWSGELPKTPVE